MTEAAAEIDAYLSAFAGREQKRKGTEPLWLGALRREAVARFETLGLPTGDEEAWKKTPVAPVASSPFRPAGPAETSAGQGVLSGSRLVVPSAIRLVFVDGRFAPGLSAPTEDGAGLFAGALSAALRKVPSELERLLGRLLTSGTRPFVALNTALFDDAAVVRIPAGAKVDGAIQIVHVAVGRLHTEMTSPRTLVVAGPGSRATVVETFLSADGGAGLTSAVAEIEIGDGASLDHVRLQAEGTEGLHLGTLQALLGRDARFASHAISVGARWARVEVGAELAEAGAECFLNGLYFADGTRHVDHRTSVDHAVAQGTSHQLYKGLLAGAARAVFEGRILVRQDAQKTDAFQSNRNLLLSDEALVFTRPQLEIHANDVKCTHGATVGQLDPEAVFYLRSRGLGADEARRLLIRAFAGEVTGRIPIVEIRERVEEEIASRLSRARVTGGDAS
jgi:Fe-S cluster assembly protein SufD